MEVLQKVITVSNPKSMDIHLVGRRGVHGPLKFKVVIDMKGAPILEIKLDDYNLTHRVTYKYFLEVCNAVSREAVEKMRYFKEFQTEWSKIRKQLQDWMKTEEYKERIWPDFWEGLKRSYHKVDQIEVKQKRVLFTLVTTPEGNKEISVIARRGDNRSVSFSVQVAIEIDGRVVHVSYDRNDPITSVELFERIVIGALHRFDSNWELPDHKLAEYQARTISGIGKIRNELASIIEVFNNNYDW